MFDKHRNKVVLPVYYDRHETNAPLLSVSFVRGLSGYGKDDLQRSSS